VNTYDPADYIVYVRMDEILPQVVTSPTPVEHRLPARYANESPGTRLRGPASARTPRKHGAAFRPARVLA
jgi:hypothetical protein